MAILKRVANKQGNGAGRALYALKHAVAVRTNIPSPLVFALDGELAPELRRELAKEFNRHLLLHQGDTKTQHFVISFGHHLTREEIEEVLNRVEEKLFNDPHRCYLFVVHQEPHGTAVHVIESADPEGRLHYRTPKELYELKKAVIRELRPFMNDREREVARNFKRGEPTRDWKHPIEIFAPQRSFKEYIRQTVEEAVRLIEKGYLDGAIELLELKGVEIKEYKAGEPSPTGKRLKRDRLYAVFNHPYRGSIAVRLDKKMRATFRQYLKALEEYSNGLTRAKQRTNELSSEVTAVERGHRGAGKGKGLIEAGSLDAGRVEGIKEQLERLGHELTKCEELLNELNQTNERFRDRVDEPKNSVKQLGDRNEEPEKRVGRSEELHSGSSDLDRVEMDTVVDGNNGCRDSNSSYGAFWERDTDPEMDRSNLSRTISGSEVEMSIPQEVIDELKQIEPEKVLGYLGIPFRKVGNRIMAQAVWRGEKEASVSIQYKDGKWLWYDFGAGEGGDWIDLYCRYTGSDFKEAVSTLMELANVPYSPNISTREPTLRTSRKTSPLWPAKTTEFEEVEKIPLRELQEPPRDLAEYLELKGFLPYWEQIREIPELYYLRYRRGNREYSGLATKTTAGTWIIKNKHGTYVSHQPSGISIWQGDSSRVLVVEGFTDAIAFRLYFRFRNDTIVILNGLGNLDKAVEVIKHLSPKEVLIALDLDEKGIEGRKKLVKEIPGAKQVYFYGKDPAEYLLDEYAREYLPPFVETDIDSPEDLYACILPSYFKGGYLNEKIVKELSPNAYYTYLEAMGIEEEIERIGEELKEFEELYLEDDEPEEDRDRGISLDL